jgi:RNA polymerase sigma-70 factor (ECF subfamily)
VSAAQSEPDLEYPLVHGVGSRWPGRADATPGPSLDAAVAALRAGSEAGFTQVYRTIHPGLVRYLRVLTGDDAEDVASETWAQAWRDLAQFRGDGQAFRGWVTTIGRHRALDHLRGQRRRPADPTPAETLALVVAPEDTADRAIEGVSTERAIALVTSLPAEQAEAVLLRVLMGLDAKTTGRVMDKRAGAVRTLAYRGLRTLAAGLEQDPR